MIAIMDDTVPRSLLLVKHAYIAVYIGSHTCKLLVINVTASSCNFSIIVIIINYWQNIVISIYQAPDKRGKNVF